MYLSLSDIFSEVLETHAKFLLKTVKILAFGFWFALIWVFWGVGLEKAGFRFSRSFLIFY